MDPKPEPTVKLVNDFKVGETAVCSSTGEEFKVLEIVGKDQNRMLRLEGRAGLMPIAAAEKKI